MTYYFYINNNRYICTYKTDHNDDTAIHKQMDCSIQHNGNFAIVLVNGLKKKGK